MLCSASMRPNKQKRKEFKYIEWKERGVGKLKWKEISYSCSSRFIWLSQELKMEPMPLIKLASCKQKGQSPKLNSLLLSLFPNTNYPHFQTPYMLMEIGKRTNATTHRNTKPYTHHKQQACKTHGMDYR